MSRLQSIHPGEILREEFMEPLGLSQYALAKAIGVPVTRISAIYHEQRSITPDTAIRLGKAFSTSADFWLNLQARYDMEILYDDLEHEYSAISTLQSSAHATSPFSL